MQQIVVNIMHRLQAAGNPTEASLKTELHALLPHEPLVNATWAQLRKAGLVPDGLGRLRQQLDAPTDSDRYQVTISMMTIIMMP